MIISNNKRVVKRYRGSIEIGRVYEGTNLVFQKQSTVKVTPLDLGAVHWLPFTNSATDEGSAGGSWLEASSPIYEDGYLKKGIVYPTGTPYNPTTGCAFSVWVNTFDTASTYKSLISVTATYSDVGFSYNPTTRAIRWKFRRGTAALSQPIAGTMPNGWVHLSASMEQISGSSWKNTAYINGQEVYNNAFNAGTQSRVIEVSLNASTTVDYLDEYAVFNRPLTAAEVDSLFKSGRK